MRISDWSSDVCSSDLSDVQLRNNLGAVGPAHMRQAHGAEKYRLRRAAGCQGGFRKSVAGLQIVLRTGSVPPGLEPAINLGTYRTATGNPRVHDPAANSLTRQTSS